MASDKIKVMIVDDSDVSRCLLTHIIDSDPELMVLNYANDGESALIQLKYQRPDVITMDIIMPKMDGFETTRQIMEERPVPIIVVTADYNPSQVEKSFKAMYAGALAILPKPYGPEHPKYQEMAKQITDTIKLVANVKLIKRTSKETTGTHVNSSPKAHELAKIEAIAIGASLGGPQALGIILSALNSNFPVPIYIVQHIASGFAKGMVEWLNTMTSLTVSLAKDNEIPLPGHVYISPENSRMEISHDHMIVLKDASKDKLHPSVAPLFKSMSEAYGPNCAGVMLTGMGKDGAAEMLQMRQKGSFTIAQDEESCVVFGMPKEVINLGGALRVVPLTHIAPLLMELVGQH